MSKRLLLADDSITIQKVIGITFANEDYDLSIVDNGVAALEKAREVRPDLILADVFMPGKNGYEVCMAVKADPTLKGVPVLLLAGTFEPFDEGKAKAAGADAWIPKPFGSQELIDKVEELLALAPPAPPVEEPVPQPVPAPAEPFFEETVAVAPAGAATVPSDMWDDLNEPSEPVATAPEAEPVQTETVPQGADFSEDELWGDVSFGEDELLDDVSPEPLEEIEEDFDFEEPEFEEPELGGGTADDAFIFEEAEAPAAAGDDFIFEAPPAEATVSPSPETVEDFVFEEEDDLSATGFADEESDQFTAWDEEDDEILPLDDGDILEAEDLELLEEEEGFIPESAEDFGATEDLFPGGVTPAVPAPDFAAPEEVSEPEESAFPLPEATYGKAEAAFDEDALSFAEAEDSFLATEVSFEEETDETPYAAAEPSFEEEEEGTSFAAVEAAFEEEDDFVGEPEVTFEEEEPALEEEGAIFAQAPAAFGEPAAVSGEEEIDFGESAAGTVEPVSEPPVAGAAVAATASPEAQVQAFSEEELTLIVEKVAGAVIERLAGTILEKIAWEVVPDLAENLVRDEIRRIRADVG